MRALELVMSDVVKPLTPLQSNVIDILIAAQRNGAHDMTADEIQEAYEQRVTNKRIGDGPFAGRISEMAKAGLIQASGVKRQSRRKGGTGPRKNAYRAHAAVVAAPVQSLSYY